MKNSIFNLSNKMGVDSPFDNWLEKRALTRKQDRLDRKRGYEEDYRLKNVDDFIINQSLSSGYFSAADLLEDGISNKANILYKLPSEKIGDNTSYNLGLQEVANRGYEEAVSICRKQMGATCMSIVNLAYFQGSITVKNFLLKRIEKFINNYEEKDDLPAVSSREFMFLFFTNGPRFSSKLKLIAPADALEGKRGDLFFDGFEEDGADDASSCSDSWDSNCGHTGILAKPPVLDGDTLTVEIYAAYSSGDVLGKTILKFTHNGKEWTREKTTGSTGTRYLLGFGRVDEAKIRQEAGHNYTFTVSPQKLFSSIYEETGMNVNSVIALNAKLKKRKKKNGLPTLYDQDQLTVFKKDR